MESDGSGIRRRVDAEEEDEEGGAQQREYYPAGSSCPNLPLPGGDDNRLKELGYKQEPRRHLSAIGSFTTTFNIISVIAGISTLYHMGLGFGGPVTMIYGWPIVGSFTLMVAFSMAEICSAYPTSSGRYFWSAKLCGNQWGPFASWLTRWYVVCTHSSSSISLISFLLSTNHYKTMSIKCFCHISLCLNDSTVRMGFSVNS
ncbi:unnamed protein product [Linum tenue]|uniref:Uncharacterized protein n=1 Tax=Linum tenue TaxID=586396 RepID=A0AAV0MMD6_9ROSI|nr:unnamed protein product [Linum tenue]